MNKLHSVATLGDLAYSSRSFARIQFIGMACLIVLAVYLTGQMFKGLAQRRFGAGRQRRALAGGVSFLMAGILVGLALAIFSSHIARLHDDAQIHEVAAVWAVVALLAIGTVAQMIMSLFRSP